MKVALIHSHLNARGGSQRYVIEIANKFKQLEVETSLFCYEYNKNSCFPELTKNLNIQKVFTLEQSQLQPDTEPSNISSVLRNLLGSKVLQPFITSLGIDYLVSIYSTKKKSKQLAKLIAQSNQEYDVIFVHEEPLSIWSAIEYKKSYNTKVLLYWFCYDTIEKWFLEWKDEHKSSTLRNILLPKFYFLYDRLIIRNFVDQLAVLDNNMKLRVQRMYNKTPLIRRGGIPEDVLTYNPSKYLRNKYSISEDKIIIFSLTRFVNYRRVHDLFEMYLQLPPELKDKVFLFINAPITDKIYYNDCEKKYHQVINSSNVILDLSYPKDDQHMYQMYLSSDIFIFPNENQTWGHAPLEAMACGVATIVSTGCGIHEVIKKVTPETIYKVGEVKSLVLKVCNLIKARQYKEIAIKQKEYVKEHLTWEKICKQYIKDFS